jgi:Uncharacterized vancomycin resistance protein
MKRDMKLKPLQALTKIMILYFSILMIGGCAPSPIHSPEVKEISNTENQEGVKSNLLPEGTKVDDLDLSDNSVSGAEEKVKEWSKDKLEETRVLLYNETEIPISLKDMGINLDSQRTMEDVVSNPGTVRPSILKVDKSEVIKSLQEKLKKFNQPAKNASYKIVKDKFIVTPAVNGRSVDINRMLEDIQKVPLNEVPGRIVLPMAEVPATVTTEKVKGLAFDSIIGQCTTKFAVYEKNRSTNLIAAAKALDRKIIRPGEIFSFNNTVGPREAGTGFKDAYVIINGEYVKGIGGGVCQVSSTLYNAVLLSNLKVVERMPHAVTVNYIAAGQDATVNYPNIDFKFQNDTASLLYLRSEAKNGVLTLQIWGKKTDKSVRIEQQVVNVINYKTKRKWDPKLKPGRYVQEQRGAKGLVVNTWKVVRDGKGQETKLFLSRDSYAPTNRILRVGARRLS